jgi:hypothetical protein
MLFLNFSIFSVLLYGKPQKRQEHAFLKFY